MKRTLQKYIKERKGFTLAELLIVVAIIAVLVSVSIPIFAKQLEKSRDAVSVANLRGAYAYAQAAYITESGQTGVTIETTDGVIISITVADVEFKGKNNDDKFSGLAADLPFHNCEGFDTEPAAGTHDVTFSYDANGYITEVSYN